MALEITGNIELRGGLTIGSLYGRTDYRVNDDSSEVLITSRYWLDETAYLDKKDTLKPTFDVDGRYSYDRTTDGVDVLDFTNEKIKAELEALGYSVVITEL